MASGTRAKPRVHDQREPGRHVNVNQIRDLLLDRQAREDGKVLEDVFVAPTFEGNGVTRDLSTERQLHEDGNKLEYESLRPRWRVRAAQRATDVAATRIPPPTARGVRPPGVSAARPNSRENNPRYLGNPRYEVSSPLLQLAGKAPELSIYDSLFVTA